jgi:hypothetical protein
VWVGIAACSGWAAVIALVLADSLGAFDSANKKDRTAQLRIRDRRS